RRRASMKKFYLTTTLPYVNAEPHIGFALEIVQADVVARIKRAEGYEVVFNFGTDEHGAKIYEKAREAGKDPQAYADEYAVKFDNLKQALNLSYTNFIRTTDPHHMSAAQEFWKRCDASGDIYKKQYKVKYCVGCELEKTDSELENGQCPIHPDRDLEIREEENYFFRFSKYRRQLLDLYESTPDFVIPERRMREIISFVEGGLEDFSVSRLKEKMPWGIPVPGDDTQVQYVWFDALINYISTLGWPENEENFSAYWPGIQFAGKDNLRQQSAMWQAMLLSAGLTPSKQVIIHGFINSNGQKMSKSLGNVISPFDIVGRYGTDALRFWLLRELSPFEDGDFTWDKFEARYQGDLANGLGNYAARALTLGGKAGAMQFKQPEADVLEQVEKTREAVSVNMAAYKYNEALAAIWELISFGDAYLNNKKPWEGNGNAYAIYNAVVILDHVAALLKPFLPGAAEKITGAITWKSEHDLEVEKIGSLFPRLDSAKPAN
ncbi:MAG: methionine--tRNA ligase, partial [Candidatus Liptonbacteria bacterium]